MKATNLSEYKIEVVKPVKGGVQALMNKDEFESMVAECKTTDGRVLLNDVHYDFVNYKIVDDSDEPWTVELYLTKAHI